MNDKELEMLGAISRAELYYAAHPGSPAAARRPRISVRSGTWIASLDNVRDGVVGLGSTVEAALRAFDRQYLNALRPPAERQSLDGAA
ncbi:MAG: hypothetical protein DMF06_01285 [Verrucomicrobia bacterium]|nr:MAG: hypothetical protein DMF06_01285 [Verrucomicrobiota bacterium]